MCFARQASGRGCSQRRTSEYVFRGPRRSVYARVDAALCRSLRPRSLSGGDFPGTNADLERVASPGWDLADVNTRPTGSAASKGASVIRL